MLKYLKLSGLFKLLLSFTLLSTLLYGGSFENFRSSPQSNNIESSDDRDSEFSTIFRDRWSSYSIELSSQLYRDKKPRTLPSTVTTKDRPKGPRLRFDLDLSEDKNSTINQKDKKKPEKKVSKDIAFDFFGTQISLDKPIYIDEASYFPQTKKGVENFFTRVSTCEYDSIVDYISLTTKKLNLNDWGKYLLVTKISAQIFSSSDESKLLSWMLLNKLNHRVKISIQDKHIVLFIHTKQPIYGVQTIKIDSLIFYSFDTPSTISKSTKSVTYSQSYPDSTKSLDLSMKTLPLFVDDERVKELKFSEYGKKYSLSYRYNQNLVDFLATYPNVLEDIYFDAPMQDKSLKDIARGLKKYIGSFRASQTLNFILHFVQSSTKYERDKIQFKREKIMFAQEAIYYDKTDAEDRVILFSYLVKKLLNIEVVALKYKNHYQTALQIPIKGNSIKIGKNRFILADPSFIGSNIGQSISKYRSKKPTIFIISNSNLINRKN